MEKSSQKLVLESRHELMMSRNEGKPIKRLAHFIKPSAEHPVFQLPSQKPTPISDPKDWPLDLNYAAWRFNFSNWKQWVDKMASIHKSTWEKVGIFELIMSSTYEIRKDSNLVLGLAEKWSPVTNTFVFPWGEVSITLEDLMASGYSVLGSPVYSPLETEELKGIEKQLETARLKMTRTASKKATHALWLHNFMDSGSEFEHEAFLALWLTRYIFPNVKDSVGNHVFSIAIHLARGIRIALAPAVLASIYRDLSLLRSKIVEFAMREKTPNNEELLRMIIWSPFQLVQIWAWERFVDLQPRPNYLNSDEPRLARWDKLNSRVENVRLVLDSSKESFDWRPYCKPLENWKFAKFYGENKMLVSVDCSLDTEIDSFARCMTVSPLVGLGFIEWYFPHRVAMQFGFDQDLPGCVDKQIDSAEAAWSEYCRPIGDALLYIPPRDLSADITARYAEWWKFSMNRMQTAGEGVVKKHRSLTRSRKKQKSPKDTNEDGKLLRAIIVKSLKQKKDLKGLNKFKRMLACSKRAKDGVGVRKFGLAVENGDLASFSRKRNISEILKEVGGVSLLSKIPKISSEDPSRTNCTDSSLKQSKISRKFPLGKKSTKELAGSLKRKTDGEDALYLQSSSEKTSEKLNVISKMDSSVDEMTATEMFSSCKKREGADVLSNEQKIHSSSMADSMTSHAEIVADSGAENSSVQSQNLSSSAIIGGSLAPQPAKITTEQVKQFANILNKVFGRCQSSSTQIESNLSSSEVNDQLSGIDDASLVSSGKPDHRNSSSECNGSKSYPECSETEARLRRVEEMISELKVAWSFLSKKSE